MTYSRRAWKYVGPIAVLAVSAFCCAQTAHAEMTVKGYTPATAGMYDRYLNDPSFIGGAYNWSGVGRGIYVNPLDNSVTQKGAWGTMISPSYFISANHLNPANVGGNALRFYHTNNPAGTYEDHSFTTVGQIIGSDLWIGKLDTPVSNSISKFPVMSMPNGPSYGNLPLTIFGLSATTGYGTATSVRLGKNQIDVINGYNNGSPVTSASVEGPVGTFTSGYTYTFNYSATAPDGEVALQFGDSGAPNFYMVNGSMPALIGINWYALTSPVGSGSSAVPKYLTALQNALQGEALSIVKSINVPLGDFSLDGTLNAADVKAMLVALTDLDSYKLSHGINQQYLLQIGDLNGDLTVTNGDLQPLLNLISTGGGAGSLGVVPEPAAIVLFGVGCLAVAGAILHKRHSCTHKPRGCSPGA